MYTQFNFAWEIPIFSFYFLAKMQFKPHIAPFLMKGWVIFCEMLRNSCIACTFKSLLLESPKYVDPRLTLVGHHSSFLDREVAFAARGQRVSQIGFFHTDAKASREASLLGKGKKFTTLRHTGLRKKLHQSKNVHIFFTTAKEFFHSQFDFEAIFKSLFVLSHHWRQGFLG